MHAEIWGAAVSNPAASLCFAQCLQIHVETSQAALCSCLLVMPELLMLSGPCAGTMQPLPTEPVTFPALCLAGRLPEQQNATVNLDLTHAQVGGTHPMRAALLPPADLNRMHHGANRVLDSCSTSTHLHELLKPP